MKKRLLTMLSIVLVLLLSLNSVAFAAEIPADAEAIEPADSHFHCCDEIPDEMIDMSPFARSEAVPSISWDLAASNYVGSFDIIQFTNTNYYFYGNSSGKIYYCISGTSVSNNTCSVRTWCKTCNEQFATFSFTPNSSPFHRVVTLGEHADHKIYFKVVAYDGGWYWSDNDFTGTISVSHSYV